MEVVRWMSNVASSQDKSLNISFKCTQRVVGARKALQQQFCNKSIEASDLRLLLYNNPINLWHANMFSGSALHPQPFPLQTSAKQVSSHIMQIPKSSLGLREDPTRWLDWEWKYGKRRRTFLQKTAGGSGKGRRSTNKNEKQIKLMVFYIAPYHPEKKHVSC